MKHFQVKLTSAAQYEKWKKWALANNNKTEVASYQRGAFFFSDGGWNPAAYNESPFQDYKVITFDEFEKFAKEKKPQGTLIGYSAPKDMFDGKIAKGTLYIKSGPYTYYPKGILGHSLPKEIVEDWEPVYENKIKATLKIGTPKKDIVVTSEASISYGGTTFPISAVKSMLSRMQQMDTIQLGAMSLQTKFWIGCSEGTLVTTADLKLIAETYDKLNKR